MDFDVLSKSAQCICNARLQLIYVSDNKFPKKKLKNQSSKGKHDSKHLEIVGLFWLFLSVKVKEISCLPEQVELETPQSSFVSVCVSVCMFELKNLRIFNNSKIFAGSITTDLQLIQRTRPVQSPTECQQWRCGTTTCTNFCLPAEAVFAH